MVQYGRHQLGVDAVGKIKLPLGGDLYLFQKFNPTLSIRTSMADYKKEDWLLNLPLWAVEYALN